MVAAVVAVVAVVGEVVVVVVVVVGIKFIKQTSYLFIRKVEFVNNNRIDTVI